MLPDEGFAPDELAKLRVPAGPTIGGTTPGEIALSVPAEIGATSNDRSGGPTSPDLTRALRRLREVAGGTRTPTERPTANSGRCSASWSKVSSTRAQTPRTASRGGATRSRRIRGTSSAGLTGSSVVSHSSHLRNGWHEDVVQPEGRVQDLLHVVDEVTVQQEHVAMGHPVIRTCSSGSVSARSSAAPR